MTKLTLKQAREVLPAEVAAEVAASAKQYHTRAISFEHRQKVYIAEDAKYTVHYSAAARKFEAGGEWNGQGACNVDAPLPVGAYAIENRFFLGKMFVTIYHNNGQEQIK